MDKKIRVIVADDSALMRKKISDILNNDPDIEVVAVVRNGKEVIEAIYSLNPDVITLDIEMPIINGLEALGYIMSEKPTPCVMISAFTKEGTNETIQSLEFGAVDFVTKSSGVISSDIDKQSKEIIEKVKLASKVPVQKLKLIWATKAKEEESIVTKKPHEMSKLITIASSTGGTQALASILPSLKENIAAGILVVQHMPEGFTRSLAQRLNWQSKISVVEAEDNMPIKPAQVIIARGGYHMEVEVINDIPCVVLNKKNTSHGLRPCADFLMESASKIFKDRTIGVVLTGMGSDGTLGAKVIKAQGGIVLAEDEKSCVVYGMPRAVKEAGFVDKVVHLSDMANEIEKLI
ncbi:chemotaxis response regulator protein-glutamate methylesterase [Candidatus Poribacteria bacterium]|nr:chemotaxis response regulator protein-glutamate methylesterase [Candidatus Poribacteria bacterium]